MPDGKITRERRYRGRFSVATFPMEASQVFTANEFINIVSGAVKNTVGNTVVLNTSPIVYTLEPNGTATSAPITCLIPTDDTEFLIPAGNRQSGAGTLSETVTANAVYNAHIGVAFGISHLHLGATDRRPYLDINGIAAAGGGYAVITEIDASRPEGNVGGLVWVKLRNFVQYGG